MSRIAVVGLVAASLVLAQNISSVYVTAPKVRVVSGERMQLSVTARDAAQNIVTNAPVTWSSSDTSVVAVDGGGQVTASGLGLADITATVRNARGIVRIQVLPQRIEVTPADLQLTIGSLQPYSAVAYDVNGAPIANAAFTWHVDVSSGGDSSTVSVSKAGMLSANTLGYYRVRAAVVYSFTAETFSNEFDGATTLTIVPRPDYKVSRLASSEWSAPSFGLRGRRGNISVNDAGQLAMVASLDGVANGLFTFQNQSFNMLAAAGAPGQLPNTLMYDFGDPSIDSRGNVLAIVNSINANNSLLLAGPSGARTLVTDRAVADQGVDITNINTNRFSLSENGQVVLQGNFHYAGSTDNYNGLFRYAGTGLLLEASNRDPLPGLDGRVSFENYAIDGAGVIWFIASAGSGRAIYRKEIFQDAQRITGIGDTLRNSTITGIGQIASNASGDLVFTCVLKSGEQLLVRYAGGVITASPQIGVIPGYYNSLYAANAKAGVVFLGDAGNGWGIYLWNGGTVFRPLLLANKPSPSGEPVQDFFSATLNSAGEVYAAIRGVDTPWMLVRATPNSTVLLTNGAPVNVTANVNFAQSPIPGDRTGGLHMMAGGNTASIFSLDSSGLLPKLVIGDKVPGCGLYTGQYPVKKSASGDLYVIGEQGICAMGTSGTRKAMPWPPVFPDGVNMNLPFNLAVNDSGQMAFLGGTNQSHQRLAYFDGSSTRAIAYVNGGQPWQTPSPAGGIFSSLSDVAINEAGQVMASMQVSGGQPGLFLYEGSAWRPACVVQNCNIGGETIASVNSALRAAGNKFCATFTSQVGNQRLACWENGVWTQLALRGDMTSDGTEINNINLLDVNRNGDVAMVVNTGMGGPQVMVRKGDRWLTVEAVPFGLEEGLFANNIFALDLRDDGRLYFTAMDFFQRLLVYEADPQ